MRMGVLDAQLRAYVRRGRAVSGQVGQCGMGVLLVYRDVRGNSLGEF